LRVNPQEESPSCRKTVFHLTNGRSNTRESATEILLLLLLATKAQKHGKSSKGEKVV